MIRCIFLSSVFTGDLRLSYLSPGNHYWPYFWSYYVGQVWPNWSKWTKMAKMTITAWPDMAKNMANMGFHAMNRTNVDHQWKRNLKICIGSKVMAKTKPYVKFWPFPLYFGPILGQKWSVKREALPMGPQSPSLYFWNQWNQENQIS